MGQAESRPARIRQSSGNGKGDGKFWCHQLIRQRKNTTIEREKGREEVREREGGRERGEGECIGSQVELNLLPVLPLFCLCFC